MNLKTSITLRCKLLCGECRELKQVESVEFDSKGQTVVTLECLHQRGELLPSASGHLSIEDVRTESGKEAFPLLAAVLLLDRRAA